MTPGALLAAVAGAAGAGGAWCLIAFARGTPPRPPAPPPRWRSAVARLRVTERQAALALGCGLAVLAFTRWPVAAIAAVPAAIALPRIITRRPARARIARLEALESWTRGLADVLGASRGLEDALRRSAATAPPPVAAAVRALAADLQARAGTEDALRRFADSVDDPVGDLIATALMLAADRRGPGVGQVLIELARDVASDVAARRAVEAERASYRTALLWIVIFLLGYTAFLAVRPGYSAPFGTPLGQVVLAAVACCYGCGLYWLHRLSLAGGPQRFVTQQPAPRQERRGAAAELAVRR
jgi:Flp pilus assembly protein TadB